MHRQLCRSGLDPMNFMPLIFGVDTQRVAAEPGATDAGDMTASHRAPFCPSVPLVPS
jgi:hypothetical protein